MGKVAVLFVLVHCLSRGVGATVSPLRVGVLARDGAAKAYSQWNATFSTYLTEAVGTPFEMVALDFFEVFPAIAQRRVDFIFTNPSHFVCAELRYNIQSITAILTLRAGFALPRFGAVLFRSTLRPDIATIEDMKGKIFESVDLTSLGGFQMGYRTLKALKLNPFTTPREFRVGGTHENVVLDVINGTADVGTVRTDTLERMAASGTINMTQIAILNTKDYNGTFPFVVSTELYPEWPLAALDHVGHMIKRSVAQALMNMNRSNPVHSAALKKAQADSWIPPLSYVPVYAALRDLELVDPSTGACLQTDTLYDAISCPTGYTKVPQHKLSVETCPENRICLSTPCLPFCPSGSYEFQFRSGCIRCSEGLRCPGDNLVAVETGYAWDGEVSTYRCKGDGRCPGGALGACAAGREGIACAKCMNGLKEKSDGTCRPCRGSGPVPVIVVSLMGVVFIVVLYWRFAIESRATGSRTAVALTIFASLLMTGLQQLGVFSTLNVHWASPLSDILNVFNLVNFDIDLLDIGCVVGTGPMASFAAKNAVGASIVIITAIIHCIDVLAVSKDTFANRRGVLVNTVGAMFFVCFTSLVSTSMAPYQCVSHPNAKTSVSRYPMVLCGSDVHKSMTALGTICLMIPTLSITMCTVIVVQFPRRIARGDHSFVNTFSFLFVRCKPEVYWFPLVMLLRNWLVSFSAVIPGDFAQVVVLMWLFLASLCFAIRLIPWRDERANVVDSLVSVAMVNVLMCGAFLVHGNDNAGVMYYGFVFTSFAVVIPLGLLAWAGFAHLTTKHRKFDTFICHHKLGAGAFARCLQLTMTHHSTAQVFIDCDFLVNLDSLFDTVGCDTERVVCLLSEHLFTRVWCLGEMATASLKNVPLLAVSLPSFKAPDDNFYTSVLQGLDTGCLTSRGISRAIVVDAVKHVMSLEHFEVDAAVSDIVGLCSRMGLGKDMRVGASWRTSPLFKEGKSKSNLMGCILVFVDPTSVHDVSVGEIIVKLVAKAVKWDTSLVGSLVVHRCYREEDFELSVDVAVLVLSKRTLKSEAVWKSIFQAQDRSMRILPVFSEDAAFAADMMQHEGVSDRKSKAVVDIFTNIAVSFAPQESAFSQRILTTKAGEIANRLRDEKSLHGLTTARGDDDSLVDQTLSNVVRSSMNHQCIDALASLGSSMVHPRMECIDTLVSLGSSMVHQRVDSMNHQCIDTLVSLDSSMVHQRMDFSTDDAQDLQVRCDRPAEGPLAVRKVTRINEMVDCRRDELAVQVHGKVYTL